MTFDEANKAAQERIPIMVTGGTAVTLYGNIIYKRIVLVGNAYDDYGRRKPVVQLLGMNNNGILTCELSDVELAPNCPEILKKRVLEA